MPERLAAFALCADTNVLLLGLASRLAFFDLSTGAIDTIIPVEPNLQIRLNDGRFVFGTKHDVEDVEPIGGFYCLNTDLTLERLPLGDCAISNSIGFSPDGARMYYRDSPPRQIRVCDYASFGNDRVFVELADADRMPNGSTVDAEGGLWNPQWGGRRVVRAMRLTDAKPHASPCRLSSRVASRSASRNWIRCSSRARVSA